MFIWLSTLAFPFLSQSKKFIDVSFFLLSDACIHFGLRRAMPKKKQYLKRPLHISSNVMNGKIFMNFFLSGQQITLCGSAFFCGHHAPVLLIWCSTRCFMSGLHLPLPLSRSFSICVFFFFIWLPI